MKKFMVMGIKGFYPHRKDEEIRSFDTLEAAKNFVRIVRRNKDLPEYRDLYIREN